MYMEVEWVSVSDSFPSRADCVRALYPLHGLDIRSDIVIACLWSTIRGRYQQSCLLTYGNLIPSDLWLKGLVTDAPCVEPESVIDLSVREMSL